MTTTTITITIEVVLQYKCGNSWCDEWSHKYDNPNVNIVMRQKYKGLVQLYNTEIVRIIRRRTTVAIDVLQTPEGKS